MEPITLLQPDWASHLRAIWAVARKELLHAVRYPLNAVFRVIEPLTWLAPVYFLGRSFATAEGTRGFAAYAGTDDYMSFILVGVVLSNYVGAVFWGTGFSLKLDMDAGLLESNWMAPVPRVLFLAGQMLAGFLITTLTSATLLAAGAWLFGFHITGSAWAAVLAAIVTLVGLYGFGLAFAGLILLLKDATTLVDVANYLVTQFSGSQFPVRALPPALLALSLALPLTYGYDLVRGFLLSAETLLPLPYEIALLVACTVLLVLLGYGAFAWVERRIRTLGTLGMH